MSLKSLIVTEREARAFIFYEPRVTIIAWRISRCVNENENFPISKGDGSDCFSRNRDRFSWENKERYIFENDQARRSSRERMNQWKNYKWHLFTKFTFRFRRNSIPKNLSRTTFSRTVLSFPTLRAGYIACFHPATTSENNQKGTTRALSIISPDLKKKKVSASTGT